MAGMAAENHGWFAYSVLFFVAAVAALLPPVLHLLVRFFKKGHSNAPGRLAGDSAPAQIIPRGQPLNTRYFTAVQIGALIALPLSLLIPLVGPESGSSRFSAISLVILCLSVGCSLVYANRKGDLKWIDSMKGPDS